MTTLRWRHNERDSVSNHQLHDCLLNRLFRRWSKKTSKFRVTGLCVGNSPGAGEFPAQMASNAENVPIWWRHHDDCHTVHNIEVIFWGWMSRKSTALLSKLRIKMIWSIAIHSARYAYIKGIRYTYAGKYQTCSLGNFYDYIASS